MNKTEFSIATVGFVASLGTSTIVRRIIKQNVSPTGKITMITIPVASFFIGEMLASKVEKNVKFSLRELVSALKNASSSTVTEL